jgi:DNA invertase Pin-like site-specific DNA recombinase
MFTSIPSAALRQLVKLSERKEGLLGQIQEIDREMVRLQAKFGVPAASANRRAPVTVSRVGRRPGARTRSKRGALKEKIVRALRSAGKKGVTIRELSKQLRVPSANLYVWFNSTGRNVRGIKKTGVAKYRLF